MANFLDDLSIYNAKAAAAITLAAREGNAPKSTLMSSLKTTANDTTLSEDVRLDALTALINIGDLLDIPLPPYFPIVTTYANSQTYTGVHNALSGLQGGGPNEYYHLTEAEKVSILNKASTTDISFANLLGTYTDNANLVAAFATKQNVLNGTGYVKANGGTITYDNSVFLTSISGIAAGGDLTGTYPNPVLSNAAVIAQVLTGFNQSASAGIISDTDSILSAIEKLNANVAVVSSGSGTISRIDFALPSSVFDYTPGPFLSGTAPLSGTFIDQAQNTFFAGPSGGGTGQPLFRSISVGDLPEVSPDPSGTYGDSTTVPQITVDVYGRVTGIANVASATGGQVNTVDFSVPAGGPFNKTVTGTVNVSILLGFETQLANTVWAGPVSGSASAPTFRALVAADIPSGIPINSISGLQNALDSKMEYSLNDGEIFIGSIANAPAMKTLSGDVTMTRDGVVTIAAESVTFSKMQEITSGTLLGRWGASDPGPIQEVGLSGDFVLDNTTGILSLAVPIAPVLDTKGSLITYTSATGTQVQLYAGTNGQVLIPNNNLDEGLEWVDMTGDVTLDTATPSGATTITAGAVTLAKMANLAANSFIGNNNVGSAATPIALSVTQATAMLNLFDTATTTKGLVSGSNGVGATYYLDATGNWSIPAGGGGGGTTTNSLTINNGGSGASSGATFNGSAAVTISYNTIGAPKTDGTGASGTWGISISGSAASVANSLTIGSGLSGTTFNGSAAVTVSLNTANANTWTSLQTFQGNIYLGETSGVSGSARFIGSSSGYVSLQAPAAASNQNYVLPTAYPAAASGYYLTSNTSGTLSWAAVSGTGDVVGPAGATANAIAVFNGTTGLIIKDSGVTFPIGVSNGGVGQTSYAVGDILYASASGTLSKLSIGTAGYVLTVSSGGLPSWEPGGGGGSGTVSSGTTNQVAYYTASTTVASTAAAGSNGTFLLSQVITGGTAAAPGWTATTGSGSVVLATSPTISTSLTASYATASTIAIFNASSQLVSADTGTYPSLPQLAYVRGVTGPIQTQLDGKEPTITTLSIAKGGTNSTATPTLGGVAYGTGSAYAFTGAGTQGYILQSSATSPPVWANLVQGSGITITNVTGSITISSSASAPLLNQIQAATGTNTINNAANAQEWQWNTLASGNGFYLSSTSTAAASNTQTLFRVGLSGPNATTTQSTYAAVISNTHTGTNSTNYALQISASGGTSNNYGIDVTAGIVRIAAGTATAPQLILTPTTATPTGTVAGSMWYYESSGTEYLAIYKTTAATQSKIITKDTNPDFATGATGVIIANSTGTLTKSADLTALGIYAQTNTLTAITTGSGSLIGTVTGSATLSTNFFAAGKTIQFFFAGLISTAASGGPSVTIDFKITDGTTTITVGSLTYDTTNLSGRVYMSDIELTCRTSGSNPTFGVAGQMIVNHTSKSQETVFITPASVTGTGLNTSSALTLQLTATWTNPGASSSIDTRVNYAYYLN